MYRFVRKAARHVARRDSGNVLIEFALALPILVFMLISMVDLGRFVLQKSALTDSIRGGAQYGIVAYHGATASNSTISTNINNTVQAGLTGVTATNNLFCECVSGTAVSCTTTCSSGALKTYLTVSATQSFTPIMGSSTLNFGFAIWTPPTSLSASATMIVP